MTKPTSTEEDYFAREDIEKRYKLAREQAAKQQAAESEALKQLHHMKCPKCGNDLSTFSYRGVDLDRCFHCNGTWLDAGELEKLAGKEDADGLLAAVARIFKRP